jgi:hypothetical protein
MFPPTSRPHRITSVGGTDKCSHIVILQVDEEMVAVASQWERLPVALVRKKTAPGTDDWLRLFGEESHHITSHPWTNSQTTNPIIKPIKYTNGIAIRKTSVITTNSCWRESGSFFLSSGNITRPSKRDVRTRNPDAGA